MNSTVRRLFVEKKKGLDVEAQLLLKDLKSTLGIKNLDNVRILNRYDVEYLNNSVFDEAKITIFSQRNADIVYEEVFDVGENDYVFTVELLPGQYDQKADSCEQSLRILAPYENPIVKSAKVYILIGNLEKTDIDKIKKYIINPLDLREDTQPKPVSLDTKTKSASRIEKLEGFIAMSDDKVEKLYNKLGLAMSLEDLVYVRNYFRDTERRDPTITEIRVLDTYWSDHCRHTTFHTKLVEVVLPDNSVIKKTFEDYLMARKDVYGDREDKKDINLMDLATIGMKYLKKHGYLDDLDESDEVNACSIKIKVDVDGKEEDYLLMFKNETHNHPTEVEPFGGASTCLGGAIRDPLSGRSYVYQAMRITGCSDPTVPVEETREGKLPQRVITTTAAQGYSSYGNQIGVPAGFLKEIYHPGYIAKRMELGAVIAAAPQENVVRSKPEKGDLIILLGGRTGRDGIGGATGSSKEQTVDAIQTLGSEVQKGNPPLERNIMRLFRKKEVSTLIKKCNDFGAGGVSVAIGELAPSISINLDLVPLKYDGLDGTEIAISESQERMAVVVSENDAEKFIQYANEENLEAVVVAEITDTGRLKMYWRGDLIVDIRRDFLDTNGVTQKACANVEPFDLYIEKRNAESIKDEWVKNLMDLNSCSQKGLVEMFDSTVGGNAVIMPLGGKYQLTPADGMVSKIPVLNGETKTGSIMTFGYDPYLSEKSPFHGSMFAVIDSLAKVTSLGGDFSKARLTFQEYFERLYDVPTKWGKPLAALLGAFHVQKELKIPSIGGKDSMSGTFMEIDVPPTLVSFAVSVLEDVGKVVTQEFKKANSRVILYKLPVNEEFMPDFESLKKNYMKIHTLADQGRIKAAMAVRFGGIAETISLMCFGNMIGFDLKNFDNLFDKMYGSIIIELDDSASDKDLEGLDYIDLGTTIEYKVVRLGDEIVSLDELLENWRKPLDDIFPEKASFVNNDVNIPEYDEKDRTYSSIKVAKPKVFIPLFPGTNGEYETIKAFEEAGAVVETFVVRNRSGKEIEESIKVIKSMIENSQIVALPGGSSAGDEPEGAGKFIAAVFRNPYIRESVDELLENRDGLILGIGNGFQALVRLGLLPYGTIKEPDEKDPILTLNTVGRHVSVISGTKVVSTKSPWLWNTKAGDVFYLPVSCKEGRFHADEEAIRVLIENNQIATQYVDELGNVTMDPEWNKIGSMYAIEGITSPDGRILGKMAHSERIGKNVCVNVPGPKDQMIFRSGVEYYTK